MDIINSVAHLIQQNCCMLKIHLKDAYYSVKILEEHSKYLKFFAGSKILKFEVLPIWIVFRFKIVTELTEPPIAVLRLEGIIITIYIDDLMI